MSEQLELFVEKETQKLDLKSETSRPYRIPGRTESPTVSSAMLKLWVREFCEWNNKSLPKGLNKKNYTQLYALYKHMLEFYDINEFRDILPQRPERQY